MTVETAVDFDFESFISMLGGAVAVGEGFSTSGATICRRMKDHEIWPGPIFVAATDGERFAIFTHEDPPADELRQDEIIRLANDALNAEDGIVHRRGLFVVSDIKMIEIASDSSGQDMPGLLSCEAGQPTFCIRRPDNRCVFIGKSLWDTRHDEKGEDNSPTDR